MNRLMNHLMGTNKKKKISILKNGGILLEELINSFDGKTNPIRCFSSDQILKATENFCQSRYISHGYFFKWYRGIIKDRLVLIKKWSDHNIYSLIEACRDISVSSQMSRHSNSLKLLGYCLEFDFPVLVCEYTEHGPLNGDRAISSGEVLPWKVGLKIAKEIANAVSYLHTAFPETIIHRNINPTNIFIDRNWTEKLGNFGLCIAIPEGKLYVESNVKGACAYTDPEYHSTRKVTEKIDIYSFGVMMLVFLFGTTILFDGGQIYMGFYDHVSEAIEKGLVEKVVDKEIWNAPVDDLVTIRPQVEAFLTLALRCVRYEKYEPVSSMIDVAKELKLIEKLSL